MKTSVDDAAPASTNFGAFAVVLSNATVAGRDEQPVIHGVDLRIRHGESVAIVGRNGSGKTSLLRLLAGLSEPLAGRAEVLGRIHGDLDYHRQQRHRQRIGYVFNRSGTWDNRSGLENITLPLLYHQPAERGLVEERARVLAERLRIAHTLDRPASFADDSARKRLVFARALVADPQLLLVDEPQVPLTPDEARSVRDVIEEGRQQRGMTVVYVDHDGDVAPFRIDRYVHVEDGTLALHSGPPDALQHQLSDFPRPI